MPTKPACHLHALLAAIVLASGAAFAAGDRSDESDESDYVLREYTLPLTDIDEIEIHASAGTLEILPLDANEVRILLEIESEEHGWMKRRRDVSDVELESDVRGRRLVLRQTEKGTNTEWTVRMPAVARTTIDMGVGEIDAQLGATVLDLHLGVGDVDVTLPEDSTGDIDIEVGVGGARVHGAHDVDRDQAFVSQNVRARGDGKLDARIELGVGDVTVELE
ncbi:MAG: hypothetical protein SV422_04100 [Pseudomonadota bacterium]|nr:hypothetical protein [Pseudomonadota bacterium]